MRSILMSLMAFIYIPCWALSSDQVRNLQNGDSIVVTAKDDDTVNKAIAEAKRVTGHNIVVKAQPGGTDGETHYIIKPETCNCSSQDH